MLTALGSSATVSATLQEAPQHVRHHLTPAKPCCLFLSSMCLRIASRRICSMTLQDTEVRLAGSPSPRLLFFCPSPFPVNGSFAGLSQLLKCDRVAQHSPPSSPPTLPCTSCSPSVCLTSLHICSPISHSGHLLMLPTPAFGLFGLTAQPGLCLPKSLPSPVL